MDWTTRVLFPAEERNFLYYKEPRVALGLTPPRVVWVPAVSSPRVKRPKRETDHLPPSSTEIKNSGAIPPLPIPCYGVVVNYLGTRTALLFIFYRFRHDVSNKIVASILMFGE
jgi:hypothetical protein